MQRKRFSFEVPWPSLRISRQAIVSWLPSRGNVLFTTLMIMLLLWAQTAGAFPALDSSAASTGTIAYQGRLADSSGNPLTSTLNMSFRLYGAATGGTPLWTEQWTGSNGVQVSDGLFNVMLGSLTTIPPSVIAGNSNLFLGITVGTDDEMSPRVQLGSVPFAVQALTVPDKSVTRSKINFEVPALLGQKTCASCGDVVERNVAGWYPVKGKDVNDFIEVTTQVAGGPIWVQLTAGFITSSNVVHYCGLSILQDGQQIRFIHLDGTRTGTLDFSCSSGWLIADLPAGTYTFRAMGHVGTSDITWTRERQIAVIEWQ